MSRSPSRKRSRQCVHLSGGNVMLNFQLSFIHTGMGCDSGDWHGTDCKGTQTMGENSETTDTGKQSNREAESELSRVKEQLRNADDHIAYLLGRTYQPGMVKVQKWESIFESKERLQEKHGVQLGEDNGGCYGAVDDAGKYTERARLHAFRDENFRSVATYKTVLLATQVECNKLNDALTTSAITGRTIKLTPRASVPAIDINSRTQIFRLVIHMYSTIKLNLGGVYANDNTKSMSSDLYYDKGNEKAETLRRESAIIVNDDNSNSAGIQRQTFSHQSGVAGWV
ncbi:hypothetical protein DFH29DRAFT_874068 [Suillus ampliporus]|nr:hypothetical protein DFH29DRAFT_874068 [Suillus ampliporus]